MLSATNTSFELCTLAIIDPATRLLSCKNLSGETCLPVVELDTLDRSAMALTRAIRDQFGFNTLQLVMLGSSDGHLPCAVFEIIECVSDLSEGQAFCTLSSLSSNVLQEAQREIIASILANESNPFGRFARLGMLSDLRGHLQTGEFHEVRQLNCGINFNLFSFREGNRSRWFKAVGQPNLREYAITMSLSKWAPRCVPAVVHAVPAWNGWVTEHVNGPRLGDRPDQWASAFERLAILQRESIGYVEQLLHEGAADWRIPQLMAATGPLFDEVALAMGAQTSGQASALDTGELARLRTQLKAMLVEVGAFEIPDALVHGDPGHGNVLASPQGPIFLDWAESYIAHPFLCAEYLLADLHRRHGLRDQERSALLATYAAHWSPWITGTPLARLLKLTPALGAFSYAVVVATVHRDRVSRERSWPMLRSMVRRAKAEIERCDEVTI